MILGTTYPLRTILVGSGWRDTKCVSLGNLATGPPGAPCFRQIMSPAVFTLSLGLGSQKGKFIRDHSIRETVVVQVRGGYQSS